MGDNNNRLAVFTHTPKNIKQIPGLLRRQDRRRLIQNQNVCAPVQYLDNLHHLFFGDRHLIYFFHWV